MDEHDILTIEEVAQYLRVSDRTVYDWANKGTIPCGKLGTTWRFKRAEVERWVDDKLTEKPAGKATPESVRIQDVLRPESVRLLEATTKVDALEAMAVCLGETDEVNDAAALRSEIFHRESLMSTGIGFSVAVPHVRLESVDSLVMGVGICREGLSDYESLDETPIRIVCMVAARPDQHALYLKTLSVVSGVLKAESVREALLQAKDAKAAYLILTQ